MPGPIIVASVVLNVLVMRREGTGSVDRRINAAIAGQIPGAVLAGVVLASVPESGLSILFAALVLAAVGLSVVGWHLRPTARDPRRRRLRLRVHGHHLGHRRSADRPRVPGGRRPDPAGDAVAVLPRRRRRLPPDPPRSSGRSTATRSDRRSRSLPGTVLGFALSGHLARRIDKGHVRPVVLWLSALTALAVLLRELR